MNILSLFLYGWLKDSPLYEQINKTIILMSESLTLTKIFLVWLDKWELIFLNKEKTVWFLSFVILIWIQGDLLNWYCD
jgi:hypothetical protein